MKNMATWSLEVGTTGVLVSGRWLRLRAVLWAALLSASAVAFFLATQYLGPWLHLPANSAYAIVLGVPLLAFILYAIAVRAAEARKFLHTVKIVRVQPLGPLNQRRSNALMEISRQLIKAVSFTNLDEIRS